MTNVAQSPVLHIILLVVSIAAALVLVGGLMAMRIARTKRRWDRLSPDEASPEWLALGYQRQGPELGDAEKAAWLHLTGSGGHVEPPSVHTRQFRGFTLEWAPGPLGQTFTCRLPFAVRRTFRLEAWPPQGERESTLPHKASDPAFYEALVADAAVRAALDALEPLSPIVLRGDAVVLDKFLLGPFNDLRRTKERAAVHVHIAEVLTAIAQRAVQEPAARA